MWLELLQGYSVDINWVTLKQREQRVNNGFGSDSSVFSYSNDAADWLLPSNIVQVCYHRSQLIQKGH